jgi:pectin methylesterase-like acyl-CoA thioesterase
MPEEEAGQSDAPMFHVPSEYDTITAALAAAAPVKGTVMVGAGTFREATTLKVMAGVSLVGSGESSVLESDDQTAVACADGAVRVANLIIRQVSILRALHPRLPAPVHLPHTPRGTRPARSESRHGVLADVGSC